MPVRRLISRLFRHARARRKISAAVLALSVLTGIAPLSVRTSAAHSCSMPCCASGGCATGACDFSFDTSTAKQESEAHCEDEQLTATHHGQHAVKRSSSRTSAESLCGAEHLPGFSVKHLAQREPVKQNAIRPHAFSNSCPPDCGAGMAIQLRRAGELALLGHAHQARPPTPIALLKPEPHPLFLNQRWRRQAKPRAPPSLIA